MFVRMPSLDRLWKMGTHHYGEEGLSEDLADIAGECKSMLEGSQHEVEGLEKHKEPSKG